MTSSEPASKTVWGFRRSALGEAILFFLIAFPLDRYLFHADRFLGVSPHPFWAIVLLLSVQYGTREGLFAAAASSLALLAYHVPAAPAEPGLYLYYFALARQPLGWFAAALVLGELRRRQGLRVAAGRRDLAETRRREESLRDLCRSLDEAKRRLEILLTGQSETVSDLCRAATRLERVEPDQISRGAMEIVRAALHPAKFSLFLRWGNTLNLVRAEGWEDGDVWKRSLRSSTPLAGEILEQRRFVCVAVPGDESLLAGEGVLAGPLRDQATGEALGMLKIEEMNFADLNDHAVRTFQAVAEWIGAAYAHARFHQTARAKPPAGARPEPAAPEARPMEESRRV